MVFDGFVLFSDLVKNWFGWVCDRFLRIVIISQAMGLKFFLLLRGLIKILCRFKFTIDCGKWLIRVVATIFV